MKKCLLFCFFFVFITIHTVAQQIWTLSDCIRYALDHNITIKQQEIAVREAEVNLLQSKHDYIPSLEIGSGVNNSLGRVLDPTTYQFIENSNVFDFNARASLSTEIFAGMRKHNQLAKSRLDLQSSLLGVEKLRDDITINITAAFLDILYAEENFKIAERKRQTLLMQKEKTLRFVTANAKTEGDVMQVEAQIAEAQNEIINTNSVLEKAKLNICQLLEIEDYHTFAISGPSETVIESILLPPRSTQIYDHAVIHLPQAQSARLGVKIAEKNIMTTRIFT